MGEKEVEPNDNYNSINKWDTIINKAEKFLDKTHEHALQGVNPGGVYQAVWTGFYMAIFPERCSRFIKYGPIRYFLLIPKN